MWCGVFVFRLRESGKYTAGVGEKWEAKRLRWMVTSGWKTKCILKGSFRGVVLLRYSSLIGVGSEGVAEEVKEVLLERHAGLHWFRYGGAAINMEGRGVRLV